MRELEEETAKAILVEPEPLRGAPQRSRRHAVARGMVHDQVCQLHRGSDPVGVGRMVALDGSGDARR